MQIKGENMKIIRYSKHGFTPQKQTYHMEHKILYHFNDFDIDIFPKHLRYVILETHEAILPFYQENYNDFEEGVWAFIEGHKNRQALNHLKEKIPCWSAELPDSALVYDVNWTKQMKLSDSECEIFGCYIPKRTLDAIKNIRRVKHEKRTRSET